MTNTLEGRTYIHYDWKLKDNLSDFQMAYCRDYVRTKTPRVVPNGKWVMEYPQGPHGYAELVGVNHWELEKIQFTDKYGVRHYLHISDKPFGYITADDVMYTDDALFRAVPFGRRILFCARQIHKGELSQTGPLIERLKYVRQACEPGEMPNVRKARERRRSNRGWVRLTDLSAASGFSAEDIVFGFWSYSGHCNYWFYHKDQPAGQLLDIVVASSPDGIKGRCPEVKFTTQFEAFCLIHESLEDLWVRRGFAYTVLRLLALGVRPEVIQPA